MKNRDLKKFFLGLNRDDAAPFLKDGEFSDGLNIRVASSEQEHGAGVAETLQGEVEILIDVSADITYYGGAIGGDFIYSGFQEVQIGSQVWMKYNWDYPYPGSKVYDNDEDNRDVYGGLYTWHQVMATDFCPAGYRVPTEADIDTLLTYLGGMLIAGGKMKEPDTVHWTDPNTDADDSSGFKGLGGGKYDSVFDLLKDYGLFWLQDEAVPFPPVTLVPLYITASTFTARWVAAAGATGYFLDVAEDEDFLVPVAGFTNLDVGNVTSALVTGLAGDTEYFFRVRAYNEIGTGESSASRGVTTTPSLVDLDGNIYSSVKIGSQEWMVENLKVTQYRNGVPIVNITEDNEGAEQLTGWTNKATPNNYDFFVSSGRNITRATDYSPVPNPAGSASTNAMTFTAGDVVKIIIDITNYKTQFPIVTIQYTSGGIPHVESWTTLQEGLNVLHHTIVANTVDFIVFLDGGVGAEDLDFKAECSVKVTGWLEDVSGAYCWMNNNIANKTPYGALYNWAAVTNSNGLIYFERAGVEEEGWRVPTKADILTLISSMGGLAVAGGKLRETGIVHWNNPNAGATDEVGFSAVGAGYRDPYTGFSDFGDLSFLWTQTPDAIPYDAWSMIIYRISAACDIWNAEVMYGLSIRCVRDV